MTTDSFARRVDIELVATSELIDVGLILIDQDVPTLAAENIHRWLLSDDELDASAH